MYKPILGFVSGGIFSGISLIFFGLQTFPEIVHSFTIVVIVLAGFLLGFAVGLLTLKLPASAMALTWSILVGVLLFFILGLIFSGHLLFVLIQGAAIALFTVLVCLAWGEDEFQTNAI